MEQIQWIDTHGSFRLKNPQRTNTLYFPIAADNGIKASLTPLLGGDAKIDQNTFLLEPVSIENLHNNRSTRNFWCCFGKDAWSATGADAKQEAARGSRDEDDNELTAGFMWQTIRRTSKQYGLSSEITSFVPISYKNTEIMLVTIKNISENEIRFTPVAAIPMYGRSADNIRDHRHVTSLLHRIEVSEYGVLLTPTLTFDERGHKKNNMTYYVTGIDENGNGPLGAIPVTEDFLGESGTFTHPEAVYQTISYVTAGTSFEGCEAVGTPVFSDCRLKPGESASFVLCLGIEETKTVRSIQERLHRRGIRDFIQMLDETKQYWREQVNIRFHTDEEQFDAYLCWITFQPILRRIYGCSFLPHHDYGKGGRGWRDLWQDCLALLLMNPSGVRAMLLDNFGGVRTDGSNATIIGSRQGEFIADRNNIARVWMDHGFWPLFTTYFYLQQTGDLSFFMEAAPYFKDRQIMRGEEKDDLWEDIQGTKQRDRQEQPVMRSVMEHILVQNLTAFYDVGEHNRIRLRGADWNDALDMAKERGESVAFTYAYAGNLALLRELVDRLMKAGTDTFLLSKELEALLICEEAVYNDSSKKREILTAYCQSVAHDMSGEMTAVPAKRLQQVLTCMEHWWKETLRKEEWLFGTPGFYNGYYDNYGRRVENSNPKELRMMLTGQVFAILSETATAEQIGEIAKAADKYLYRENAGGYCLNTDFGEVKDDLGRMFGFAYGHKENGAVFSHMAVMYGNALYRRGFVKEGFRALDSLYRQAADTKVSRIYPGIPEYFDTRGRGKYHYLTGAASWYLMTVLTEMFGIHGDCGDLCLCPKLLKEQFDAEGKAGVSFPFLGRRFKVTYHLSKLPDYANNEKRILKEEILALDTKTEHEIHMEVTGWTGN